MAFSSLIKDFFKTILFPIHKIFKVESIYIARTIEPLRNLFSLRAHSRPLMWVSNIRATCPQGPLIHSAQAPETHGSLCSGRDIPSHAASAKTRMLPLASRRWHDTLLCRKLRPHDVEHLDHTVDPQLIGIHNTHS